MMICFSNNKYKHNLLIRKIFSSYQLHLEGYRKDTARANDERMMSE